MNDVSKTDTENRTASSKSWWKATFRRTSALLTTLLCVGCATAPLTGVAPLLDEARQNEVAAFAKNRDRSLRVVGIVLQTGMDAYNRVVADGIGYGWAVSVSAREELEHYPYAIVGDAQTPSPDFLKCLFSLQDAESVGRLRPGMKVILEGKFHQYVQDQGRMILVLSDCSLD